MSNKDINSLLIDNNDNVVVAVKNLNKGNEVLYQKETEIKKLIINDNIKFGHKISIKKIKKGEKIIKYGAVIGKATQKIEKGEHVHLHNVEGIRGRGDKKEEKNI